MREHWSVQDGVLVFDGEGDNLCSQKDYGDFEMFVDWKIKPDGDSGAFICVVRRRCKFGIWLGSRRRRRFPAGCITIRKTQPAVGKGRSSDRRRWNTFKIRMVGEKVTVCG